MITSIFATPAGVSKTVDNTEEPMPDKATPPKPTTNSGRPIPCPYDFWGP